MPDKKQDALKDDEILQRTQDGYEKTKVKDIPLSEKTGEARRDDA